MQGENSENNNYGRSRPKRPRLSEAERRNQQDLTLGVVEILVDRVDRMHNQNMRVALFRDRRGPYTQEQYLRDWHTSQTARATFNNAFNTIINNFRINNSKMVLPCDMEESSSDEENSDLVHEGITMAIESQGLHAANEEAILVPCNKSNQAGLPDKDKIKDGNEFIEAAVSAAINEKGLYGPLSGDFNPNQ